MIHIDPRKRTTRPTFGLFVSGHSSDTKKHLENNYVSGYVHIQLQMVSLKMDRHTGYHQL